MNKRDLNADLAFLNEGPDKQELADRAFHALPHAIERTLAAEAEVERLRLELAHVRSVALEFDYMALVEYFDAKEAAADDQR